MAGQPKAISEEKVDDQGLEQRNYASKDSIAAKAKRNKVRSQRLRWKDRTPSGQPGHAAFGLSPTESPTGWSGPTRRQNA
jgi:hypothetical protein